ncbi:YitT family protein [Bacillus sp. OTU530]|uniref:YitT family protein n=1 Tax=Bacillus sp. OTU530 TaxID=3043862 RepID=UPI00313A8083
MIRFHTDGKLRVVYELAGLTIGCFLFAFGTNSLLTPAHLLAGGLGGVCVIFYHLFGWPIGIQYFLYNVPLLVLGYLHIGSKFIVYTVFSVIVSSLFFDWIPVRPLWTEDILLCSIFGAIISGMGAAFILRLGGSVGGLDILARIIAKYFNISIGTFGLLFSASIVAISAVIFDFQSAMYTILSFFVGTRTYDIILHIAERTTVMIVTNHGDEVSAELNKLLNRGVTSWNALGVYSNTQRTVLLCVIINVEWTELIRIVKGTDPESFVLAVPTKRIEGNFKVDW